MEIEQFDTIVRLLRKLTSITDSLTKSQASLVSEVAYLTEVVGLRIETDALAFSQQPVSAILIGPQDDFVGLNWYPAEARAAPSTFAKWSGPGRLSTLHIPLDRALQLKCRLQVGEFAPGVGALIGVFIDGQLISSTWPGDGCIEFKIEPASMLRPSTEIGLLAEATRRPCDVTPGALDERWLGFEFCGLEIFPSSPATS